MFKFLKKITQLNNKVSLFSYDQAVILEIMTDLEFNNVNIQDAILELEKVIKNNLPDNSGIDGHEFGDGECTIYIYGPKADEIWHSIEHILKKSEIRHFEVTLQYGKPDNPKTKEKKFTL